MEWLLVSWPTLILFGFGLRMSLRLTYGARGPEPSDPIYDFLSICSWVLIGLGFAPAIIGGVISVFGIVLILLAAATLVEIIAQRRAAQRRSICTLLALLVERKQRIESSTLLAGEIIRGRVGRAAKKLFDSLNAGAHPGNGDRRKPPRAAPRGDRLHRGR